MNRDGLKVVSYGGGRDSTALLIGLHENGIRPDLILFADPGSEHPETLKFNAVLAEWLRSVGFPEITTVRKTKTNGEAYTLEQNCLEHRMLPSIAYGYKKCSLKFKIGPQDKYLNNWSPARSAWKKGQKVFRLIGFNAGEPERMRFPSSTKIVKGQIKPNPDYRKYEFWYPLIEDLNWTKDDCVRAIKRAGLPVPRKSACTFCPSSKVSEIIELSRKYPDLAKRALAMEANAKKNLQTIKGLGRRFAWSEVLGTGDIQYLSLFDPPPIDCMCVS